MARPSEEIRVRLIGDYALNSAPPQPFVVTHLASGHCTASQCGIIPPIGTEVDVWIGAYGPLSAQIQRSERNSVSFRFRSPLSGAVLHHFAAA
ncbi:hypothetical protein [Altericroceibacterium xinjiangense]|uniref:hypothetical protein n=1 Tax=Altericroceibacterium xinjiangense TaxID=762261 RepID=UPI000F7F9461|nr:hypothetical protein [Altericroceibacterium xinjiangense]